MKPGDPSPESEEPEAEAEVRAYLEQHPDFFARNAALVEGLLVPHACGPAHSLIEHQVSVLRRRNRLLDRELRELVRNARRNERLSHRTHALVLDLLECDDVGTVLDELHRGLREGFRTAIVVARFLMPAPSGLAGHPAFAAGDAGLGAVLAELTAPHCGAVPEHVAATLFGRDAPRVGSAVLVPLMLASHSGILAVAAEEPERFRPQMGTLFLEQLGAVVARLIGRLLEPGRAPAG